MGDAADDAGVPGSTAPASGHAGWADLSGRAKFQLTGPDRVRYLNGQVTNNVALLRPGESCWALVCTAKGRLEGEVFVRAESECLRVDAPGELREALLARLEKYLIADDCAWEDVTDAFSLWHELGAGPVSRFGVPGRDVWWPVGTHPAPIPLSAEALDLLRLEHRRPVWGAELTPDVLPQEAGVESEAIDFHKGCYVGQEVISRLKSVGHVNRHLKFFEGAGPAPAPVRPGDRLFFGDPPVDAGWVTSARWHPRLEKSIALGYVRRTLAAEGAVFQAGPDPQALASTLVLRNSSLV